MADLPLIRTLNAALPEAQLPPDAELLKRYAANHDNAAFELLVRRHAELVWKVCRGVIAHDLQAAEDAFQATFLVLARKAASVGKNLPGWLFRVSRRVAIRANKRRPQTTTDFEIGQESDLPLVTAEATAAVLEEVERLTAYLRDPVLLCFYEGHTHAEAAAKLGWPIGTLASRLARAKEKLRDRLTRRGVTLSVVGVTALLSSPVSALGPAVLRVTLTSILAPIAAVPAPVLALSNGVLFAMRLTQLKLLGGVSAVLIGLAGVGIAIGVGQEGSGSAGKPAGPKVEAPRDGFTTAVPDVTANDAATRPSTRPTVGATDSDLRRLQIARFQLALAEYDAAEAAKRAGVAGSDTNWETVNTLVSAAAEVFPPAEVVKWYRWRVAVAKRKELIVQQMIVGGATPKGEGVTATRLRVEAEIDLLKWNHTNAIVLNPRVLNAAQQQIATLEQTLALNKNLIDGGAWDVNTLFYILTLQQALLKAQHELLGDTPEALPKFEAVLEGAKDLNRVIKKRFETGTVRQQELTLTEAQVASITKEIEKLKVKLGIK